MGYLIQYVFLFSLFGLFLLIFKSGIKYLKDKNKKQVENIDKTANYRDIPCFANIELAYWLLYNFSDNKQDDLNNGLLSAYLLRWYKNGYIDVKSTGKSNNYNIDLKDGNWNKNHVESSIYDFLKEVSGNNNILEKKEIKNYCSVDGHTYQMKFLFKHILNYIQDDLQAQKYIEVIPPKDYFFFKTQTKIVLSQELINEYQNLIGLKNFLLDYSMIEEKQHIEVHIWEDYLIFANILGIADKVKAQFKKIFPDFNFVSKIFDISLDDTYIGQLDSFYAGLKYQYFCFMVIVLLIFIMILGKGDFIISIMYFLPLIIFIGYMYWLLNKYLVNKKVKEMYGKMYAKITEVEVSYSTEWNSETNREYKVKNYIFTYEYTVNGMRHTGCEHSKSKKRKGQSVKIYYNEMKPEKSETAQKHNYYLNIFIKIITFAVIFLYLLVKYC